MLRALPLALLLAAAPPAARAADDLDPATGRTAAVALSALALTGAANLAEGSLVAPACRWCAPTGIDRSARDAFRFADGGGAARASDVLVLAVPLALAGADLGLAGGDLRRAGEDLAVAGEAIAVTVLATEVLKLAVSRRRPYALGAATRGGPEDDLSFPSGHTSSAFAAAAAFGTVARLRGYAGAWAVYAGGFAGAATVGWLRMAADRHWLTDVVAGAALGTAAGVGLPLLLHRREPGAAAAPAALRVTVVPLGVAGAW
jgi:hypothetical protein